MHIPKRMCVACRQMKPKQELIKVVKTPDGCQLDEKQKKFGRGAYVCKNSECIKTVVKRRGFSKHFKMQVEDSIYDEISSLEL